MIDNNNNYCHEAEKVQDRLPITTVVQEEGEQDISTTAISSGSTSTMNASPTTKKISFGNCQIRTYPQVLGDHPCCLEGCPIQLGWKYQEEKSITLDDYENDKKQHNSMLAVLEQKQVDQQEQDQEQDHELRLLPEERKRIILSTQEFSVLKEDQPSSSSSSERKLFHECRKLNRKNIHWSY
mmetsp:Transcript_53171/g.61396  ORF Transcript_53171/g.61396 Transcript_53171/m.61396 type:complete len:182 (-) Transcript_53171:158-703(-)